MSDLETSSEVTTSEPESLPIKVKRERKLKRDVSEDKRAKILEYAARGITQAEICKFTGLSKSTVQSTIKRFSKVFEALPRVNDFRGIRADILDAATLTALETAMTPSKLAKASFISAAQGAQIFDKMARLERGQSTENHAVNVTQRVTVNGWSKDE